MASTQEEPMQVDGSDEMAASPDKDGVQISLSLKWLKSDQPQKPKTSLQKLLQTWFNNRNKNLNCSVVNIEKDGTALIKVTPTPDVSELLQLSGKTLTSKDEKTILTILAVILAPLNLDSQGSDDKSKNPSSSTPGPQPDGNQSEPVSKDGDPEEKTPLEKNEKPSKECFVSLGLYWYVNHIYKEEMKRIEKENKVKIEANVSVKFKADREDGSPKEAFDQFTKLVQGFFSDFRSSVHPLKFVDPDQLSDAMRIFQDPQNKLFLTMSSEEMTVCGPAQSLEACSAAINAMQKRNASPEEFKSEPRDTSLKINMTIKDPIVSAGLPMDQSHWKQMTADYSSELAKIKRKFGVDFNFDQGKTIVYTAYKEHGGNASLESHAIRALLQLYQKIATSHPRPSQRFDATGFSDTDKFSNDQRSTEGAPAGEDKDDTCPICLSTFIDKKQLKCKHEFCKTCLQYAEKHSGPICPVCKDVFGDIMGDQPDGTMKWSTHPTSVPGYPGCGHILIQYIIPGALQKEYHPNPGQYFTGANRVAYLPDNKEGNEVLQLLKKAFDQKLTFTVGASRTTGAENQVTWNDIHHKTSMYGGPESYGYPDPDYLKRVKEELKAKGIK